MLVKGGAGGRAGQTDLCSDTISSSFVSTVRQMVLPAPHLTYTHVNQHTLPAGSVKDHTSFHYPSLVLDNNIRWGNNSMLSETHFITDISPYCWAALPGFVFFLVKLSLHSPPTLPPPSIKQHMILLIKSDLNQLPSGLWHQWEKGQYILPR